MTKFNPVLLAHNLNYLIRAHKLNMAKLSRLTHVPEPTIKRLCNVKSNSNPTIANLQPIAEYFNISINKLITAKLDELTEEESIASSDAQQVNTLRRVPLIDWRDAIAWQENYTFDRQFPSVVTEINVSPNAFALKLPEDYDNGFKKDSIIIINPGKVANHMDFVVTHKSGHNEASLKQLIDYENDKFLKPLREGVTAAKVDEEHQILGVVKQIKLNMD